MIKPHQLVMLAVMAAGCGILAACQPVPGRIKEPVLDQTACVDGVLYFVTKNPVAGSTVHYVVSSPKIDRETLAPTKCF